MLYIKGLGRSWDLSIVPVIVLTIYFRYQIQKKPSLRHTFLSHKMNFLFLLELKILYKRYQTISTRWSTEKAKNLLRLSRSKSFAFDHTTGESVIEGILKTLV